jgi:hypothetical protein
VRRTLVLAAVIAVLVTACTGGGSNTSDRRAAIYSAVIRAVLADTPHPKISKDTSVFVVAAHERSPISLEVQADIVAELHELATIRFVDHRVEAIDDSNPNRPVKNNGVLITLGKIPSGANPVTVNAGRYLNATDTVTYRVTVKRTKTEWKPIDYQRPMSRSSDTDLLIRTESSCCPNSLVEASRLLIQLQPPRVGVGMRITLGIFLNAASRRV